MCLGCKQNILGTDQDGGHQPGGRDVAFSQETGRKTLTPFGTWQQGLFVQKVTHTTPVSDPGFLKWVTILKIGQEVPSSRLCSSREGA